MRVKPNRNSKRGRKRVGRGISAGQGKTCGRGQKGQKAREGVPRGFEGGRTALHHRLPQLRGISKKAMNIGIFRKEWAEVNVGWLDSLPEGTEVSPEFLLAEGFIKKLKDGVKILGQGELSKPLTVRANAFSASARQKIEAVGGKVEES